MSARFIMLFAALFVSCGETGPARLPLTVELLFDAGDYPGVVERIDGFLFRLERDGASPGRLRELRHLKALSLALDGQVGAGLDVILAEDAGDRGAPGPEAGVAFALELAELDGHEAARAVLVGIEEAWPAHAEQSHLDLLMTFRGCFSP